MQISQQKEGDKVNRKSGQGELERDKEAKGVQCWTSEGWDSSGSDKVDIFFTVLTVIGIVLQTISVACFIALMAISYK